MKRFFKNLDLILNITNDGTSDNGSESASQTWETFFSCSHDAKNVSGVDCKPVAWKAVRSTARFIAEAGTQVVKDLTEYFEEISDQNADFLQKLGFTRKTGLHILFEEMPSFIDILFNSFLDLNFMKEISRAAGREFWNCETVVDSLVLPTDKHITEGHIKRIKPYVCPSIVHWFSLPTEENVLLDVFARSQDLYFNKPADEFYSKFEDFYDNILNFQEALKIIPEWNTSKENVAGMEAWIAKFRNIGKTLIKHDNQKSVSRHDILHSNFMVDGLNNLFLIRISYIIEFMYRQLSAEHYHTILLSQNSTTQMKDYETFLKILSRKPEDTARLIVYAITESLTAIEDHSPFEMVNSLDLFCQANSSVWSPEKMWIKGNIRIMKQFCKCDYAKYLSLLAENDTTENFLPNKLVTGFIETLDNLTSLYNTGSSSKITWKDTFTMFLKLDTDFAGENIKNNVMYIKELGLRSMITFEHSKVNYWNLSLTLINGKDWWTVLKQITNETVLVDVLENSGVIVEDVISNMSRIKIIRLVKDINVNDTDLLCEANISDYIPDKTQLLNKLKEYLCDINQTALYFRIPPLRLATQIYNDEFIQEEDIDEVKMFEDIKSMEENLILLMKNGPQSTQLPYWLSEDNLHYYSLLESKLSEAPSRVEIGFLLLNNIIDASTLFHNISYSSVSSTMTPWMKQINLQLIKSPEYSALVCDLPNLTDNEIYNHLIDNFHWDLALQEVISGRNYTWFELNKSLNELSDTAKHYTHNSIMGSMDKVMACLLNSTDDHPISKASMYITLGSRVVRLIRIMVPQLKTIESFPENPAMIQLKDSLLKIIPVNIEISKLIKNETGFKKIIMNEIHNSNESLFDDFFKSIVNINKELNLIENALSSKMLATVKHANTTVNAQQEKTLKLIVSKYFNTDYVSQNKEVLLLTEFWSFEWIQNIGKGVESVLWHSGQMLKSLGNLQWDEIKRGVPTAIIDVLIYVMKEQFVDNLVYRIDAIMQDLHPLFDSFQFENDLRKVSVGLKALTIFRKEIIATVPLKFEISKMFQEWDELQEKIINKTRLPRRLVKDLQYGSFNLGPLINPEYEVSRVEDYVCGPTLSKLLQFNSIRITLSDVSKHLCMMTNTEIRSLALELLQNLNFTYLSDKALKIIIQQVMKASDLTEEEGNEVIKVIGETGTLIKKFQSKLSNLSVSLKQEPLLQTLQNSTNLMDTLANPNILADAGIMLCGKPFYARVTRVYQAIGEIVDNNQNFIQEQFDSAPTEFCREFQREILKSTVGKVLWSYAKPLLMGKILYTPHTAQISKILTRANESFSTVGELTSLLHELSDAFISLEEIMQHESSLDDIYLIIKSPQVQQRLGRLETNLLGNQTTINFADINLNDVLDQFGDADKMKKILQKLTRLTDCISLDRFTPVDSEEELEMKAVKLMRSNEFLAGLVFLNVSPDNESIEYKIRMDIDNVPSTSRNKNQFWTPGPDADFIDNLRYLRGFTQLQDVIDKAIIQTRKVDGVGKREANINSGPTLRNSNSTLNEWSVYTQQMPYPCWVKDDFQTTMYESQALIVAFFFCLILTVSSVVRFIVWERESGNTALMCVMGMKRNWHTLSWLLASFVEVTLTMLALCVVLKWGGILPHTDSGLLLLILINFGVSILMFCYMISSTFKSASLGSVSAAIMYLLTFMPFIIIIAMEAELKSAEKIFASIFMSSGFSYSLLQIGRLEVQGSGLQWHNMWKSPKTDDTMSVALSCLMVFIDSCLYALIGLFINFMKYRDNFDVGVAGVLPGDQEDKHRVGVRIVNLNKTYGRGNVQALSDVTVDLYKGQITTLLGHNGAGKSTLINILTGIIAPTSGQIIVNTNLKSDTGEEKGAPAPVKNTVGLCPQFDVLLESLTAREHLAYYAQLKTGHTLAQVSDDVNDWIMLSCAKFRMKRAEIINPLRFLRELDADAFESEKVLRGKAMGGYIQGGNSMLSALGLGPLSEEPVKRLSGGLRRRLCVGLAFISRPYLVVLDEPSSGVDPVARRDIWTLILSLKAERTILLTTHHLDEAEVLSDTVFVMHKGKIQASGSPFSLKQNYGEGYKLTLSYPYSLYSTHISNVPIVGVSTFLMESNQLWKEVDHRVKPALEVVRDHTTNAKLIQITSDSVQINVPFLNSQGERNNMLALTRDLEEKPLEFISIAVDTSGLEQVFLSLCEEKEKSQVNVDTKSNCVPSDSKTHLHSYNKSLLREGGAYTTLWRRQLMALLYKRFLHYVRNPRLLIAALVLPTMFVAVAMGFSLIRPPPDSLHALNLRSHLYGNSSLEFASFEETTSTVYKSDLNKIIEKVINMSTTNRNIKIYNETGEQCECLDGWQSCSKESKNDFDPSPNVTVVLPTMQNVAQWIINTHHEYIEKRYGGWSSIYIDSAATPRQQNNFVVWYNNKGQHSMPAYLNELNNAILKYRTGKEDVHISTYSHPLKLSPEQLSKATLLQHVADVGISVVLLIGFSLVPAVSAVFLVYERCSQQKRLQLLSAVHPLTYWLASLIWDVLIMCVAIMLSAIVFKIFALPVYVSKSNLSGICFLLLLYGVSSSTLVHLLEKLFKEASLANMIIFCCNVFVSVVGLTVLLIIDVVTTSNFAQQVRRTLHGIFLLWPGFSLGDGLVSVSRNSIQADVLVRFGLDTYLPPLSWDVLGPHCLVLSFTAVTFFVINVLIELRVFDGVSPFFYKKSPSTCDYKEEDRNVATERYRIELVAHSIDQKMKDNEAMKKSGKPFGEGYGVKKVPSKWEKECDVLQVLGLRKEYPGITGTRVAVQSLTFGVKKEQCFGLLGINGAGKSTTFNMLTGEIKPTSGHIYLNGRQVSHRDLCNGSVAYCPQSDALDDLLTLNEHLQFYCRIRGIRYSKAKIENIMDQLELTKYKTRRTCTLSGGNKRKLCLAIALLSEAKLLLLDEPTSGMDPKARQQAGAVLMKAAQRGKALLLSSHSLLECEALCSPAALMWHGKFLALATPYHLKQSFASGHVVSLVGCGSELWKLAKKEWEHVRLVALHPCSVQILINEFSLATVFQGIASLCTQAELKDYSVNQSSLEQVFINVSNSQTTDTNKPIVSTLQSQYSQQASCSTMPLKQYNGLFETENKYYNTKF